MRASDASSRHSAAAPAKRAPTGPPDQARHRAPSRCVAASRDRRRRALRPVAAGDASPRSSRDAAVERRPAVDLGRGLVLPNPILVASGTFGYGVEYGDVVDVDRLGAICCKGTTLKPRIGNPTPRVTETPGGMLNSIGLQNPGVDAVIEKYADDLDRWQVPVIVNVAGESVDGLRRGRATARRRARRRRHRAQHLLPERRQGRPPVRDRCLGRRRGDRRRPPGDRLPLLVKLSPNVADIRPIARAIEDAGADALTAINTLSGIAVDPSRKRPLLGNMYGGLSGPAIKPVALRIVYEAAQVVSIPIVAIGGVMSWPTSWTSSPSAPSRSRSARRSSPTRRCRSASSTSSRPSAGARAATYRPLVGTALPARPGAPSAKGVEYRPDRSAPVPTD